jgi:LysR family tcuABC transcriptional regulator
MQAMRERYPDVRLHMVESLSGHLSAMLNARQLDLAVLFDLPMAGGQSLQSARRWSVLPLIEEDIFLISARSHRAQKSPQSLRMSQLCDEPLILPTGPHGLRSGLNVAFARAKVDPRVVMEMDSLAMLMDAVGAGLGSTLQPWSAVARIPGAAERFGMARISDHQVRRVNFLCGLSEDELSPAALATRVVLADCVRTLVRSGVWLGASLSAPSPNSEAES